MQHVTNQQKLKPWMGFALFAFVMLVFVFVCGPMQSAWRLWGLIATEAVFLIIAIAYGLIFRIPLKEMFPLKKFKVRDFFGSLFLVAGGSSIGLVSIALVGILIPSSLESSDVQAISEYTAGSAGYLLTMFAMALMPAICEEAIQRGAIIANFRTIKKDWIIVLIMGLFFGIFHLSVLRFINTAIMGACLSYIVVKKNNMMLSCLMHFTINFVSSSLSVVLNLMQGSNGTGEAASTAAFTVETMKAALGTYLLMGFAAPIFIVLGLMLLNPESHKKIRFLFAGIAAFIMFAGGIAVTVANSTGTNTLVKTNISYLVDAENTEALPLDFSMEEEGTCTVAVVVTNAEGNYNVKIAKKNGEVVSNDPVSTGALRMYTTQIELEPGDYELIIVNCDGTINEKPVISVQINKN